MKVTEQLEWDYDSRKNDDGSFIKKATIKDKVAAELFIPIVELLYNNNIFTSWSGLTEDAHIRIPMDGLSRENYLIAKENCEKGINWRVQKPPYADQEDIIPNYSFEIYIQYDQEMEVENLIKKLLEEVRKLKFQDVQIARTNYAKESKLPRITKEGLYEKSKQVVFDIKQEKEIEIMAENDEELMEMFCDGENPEYCYDSQSNTFFRNKELISKSREYEAFVKISDMIKDDMSSQEKYKLIYDWLINNFQYAYSGLYRAYAECLATEESSKGLQKFFRRYGIKTSQTGILNLEHRKKFLEAIPNLSDIPEEEMQYTRRIVELLEKSEQCKKSEKQGDTWISKYGVCQNFAVMYESLCKRFGLPCRYIEGTIDSEGFNVGHAWNAIMVNGKVRYVDVSGAIHCKDGTNQENNIEDFFNKSFEELKNIDNGKNRKIKDYSIEEIQKMIDEQPGFDFDD